MTPPSTVLIIAAHPDDEVLGCGALMAKRAAQGVDVQVGVVTAGAPRLFPAEQVAAVRAECERACAHLGVSQVHFMDFPAPQLDTVAIHEVADALRTLVQDTGAEEVYLPHRGDVHLDHQVVYNAGLVAVRPLGRDRVRRVLCYETLSETEWASPEGDAAFIPTVFVDVSDHIDAKVEAMGQYVSQLKDDPHPRSESGIRALARFRGATAGLMAAEAFMLIREVERPSLTEGVDL